MSPKKNWQKMLVVYSPTMWSLFSLFLLAFAPLAQGAEWSRVFGGSGTDIGYDVRQTTDDGYIIVGRTESYGAGMGDVYLLKTDPSGNMLWQKTFGGSLDEYGSCVRQTTDGGYIISGVTESFGAGDEDVYLLKTDPNGDLLWQKTFGGVSYDFGYGVRQTADGGYIVVGGRHSLDPDDVDVYLLKTDQNGEPEWEKTLGGGEIDAGHDVEQTTDGGYIIVGDTYSYGNGLTDIYLVKTDPKGEILWQNTFGTTHEEIGNSVRQSADGGYILAGTAPDAVTKVNDAWLVKADKNGQLEWQRTFGGRQLDGGGEAQQTADGGYIIAGYIVQPRLNYNAYLVKTDKDGNPEWEKAFGGPEINQGTSIQQTADGGYIVTGNHQIPGESPNVYLLYYRPEGGGEWQAAYSRLFASPADLDLFRRYRDERLAKTTAGALFTRLLYEHSAAALAVLMDNPGLMAQARGLISANKAAVAATVNGGRGVIGNSQEVISFLASFAEKSPPALKLVVNETKTRLQKNRDQGQPFLGFSWQ